MNKIYQVLSNLNHSGTIHKAGSFFESAEAVFEGLVKDKILRVIEGAKSLEHAAEIVAGEIQDGLEKQSEAPKAPENTWGPQADRKPEGEKPEEAPSTETKPEEHQAGAPDAPKENAGTPINLDSGITGDNL